MALNTNPDSLPKDNGAGFLRDLSPSIKRHPYKGPQHFLDTFNRQWRRQTSEWTLLTNVNPETFTRDFDSDPDAYIYIYTEMPPRDTSPGPPTMQSTTSS